MRLSLSFRLLLCLTLGCLFASPAIQLYAQSTQGSILGTVTDPSGAAVSNAPISVTNIDTATIRTTQTGAAGNYQVLNLEPGHYAVHVDAPGFKSIDLTRLTLVARQQLRADATLTVGNISEAVTVDAASAGAIETETASISASLDSADVKNLPANYRASSSGTSPLNLIQSLPGVQSDTGSNNGTGVQFSVQGGLPFQTEVTVDGITSQSATSNSPLPNAFPSGESIAELRVDGVLNNAEYGQPGEVTTISKAGTNLLHGGIFWYHQNAAFNATPFGATKKPALVGNDFGGTIGGPVNIPHLYNGRDKTFFFGTYEGFRLPHTQPNQYIVPTADMKKGIFSNLQPNSIRNPFVPGTYYANNTVPINPAANAFLQFFPDPNFSGPGTYPGGGNPNYYINQAANQTSNQFDLRGDQYVGQKALFFARYTWKNYNIGLPEPLLVPQSQQTIQDRIFVASANYNFTPHLINEFRFGFTLDNSGQTNGFNGPGFATSTGLQGLTNLYFNGVPELDFNSLSSLNADRLTSITKSRTFQYLDNVSWQIGRHNLKFGVDLRHIEAVTPLGFFGADNYGTFDFSSAQFTGQEFADFLIGTPNVTAYDQVQADNDGRSLYDNAFAQDEWHALPNLVLSYGVRYEYHPAYSDPSGNIGNFDPSVPKSGRVVYPVGGEKVLSQAYINSFNGCGIGSSVGAMQNGAPCTPVLSNSQAGVPAGLRNVPKLRFMPRFGVAYRPFNNDRTVIRGGFGMYDITLLGRNFYSLTGTLQSYTVAFPNLQTASGPSFVWPAISAGAGINSQAASYGKAYFGTANDINWKDPYSEQYSLSLDRDFGRGYGLRLSFIGMETHHLVWAPNLNDLPYSSTTSAFVQPLSARPFPNWGTINTRSTSANESYNSGQIEFSHHMNHGLEFDSTYTFAKNLADNQGPTAGSFAAENGGARSSYNLDRTVDFGNVYGTRRHRWSSTMLYDLPFGRGRMYGANMGRLADAVVGGWRLSNILVVQSGPFLSAYIPGGQADPSGTGSGLNGGLYGGLGGRSQKPDRVGSAKPANQTRSNWINTTAFVCPGNSSWVPGTACRTGGDPSQPGYLPPIGRFGNAQIGSIVGPGTFNLSSGLSKVVPITEHVNFRMEGTFTNVLNHTNLADPALNITKPNFGTITSARGSDFAGSRTGQISARIDF